MNTIVALAYYPCKCEEHEEILEFMENTCSK